jgi:hypothetical protein
MCRRTNKLWAAIPIPLFCLLLAGTATDARAAFVGAYAFPNFTLTNSGGLFPNGTAFAEGSDSVVIIGTNDGSGLAGSTDLTILARNTGLFQFDYLFTTSDDPAFEFAGYLVGGNFFQFADTDGESGRVTTTITSGQTFGFRVGSVDNTGSPGILTITDFSTPAAVPEPDGLQYLIIAASGLLGVRAFRTIRRTLPGPLARLFTLFTARHSASAIAGLGIALVCSTVPLVGQPQVFYSGSNVTGSLAEATVVNLRQVALPLGGTHLLTSAGAEPLRLPPPRLRPNLSVKGLSGAASAGAGSPPVTSLTMLPATTASGFNALSHLDQRNANAGNQLTIEPPNQSIASANGFVLEGVNDAIQIFSTSGSPQLPLVLASNQLFGLPPDIIYGATNVFGPYLTDMRVFFDKDINRWIVVQRSQDNDIFGNPLNSSHLYIAVSQSGDPTASYTIYVMDTTNPHHIGCPCVDDYPQIGSDQYGFHIAWNEFTANSLSFVDATILTLSKASLAAGAPTPVAFQFFLPFASGFEFAIQPATTPPGAANFVGNGGVEYFVSTSASFPQVNAVAVWAMANTSSLGTPNPNPTLTRIFVPTLSYTFPDVAAQRPGITPLGTSLGEPLEFLDGGDSRVQSLSYAAGRLYLTFPTSTKDENQHVVVGGAYVVLSPTYRSGVLAAQVANQGYLVFNNNHLLRPALAVNAQGAGAIAVTLVGTSWYPSAALIPFPASGAPSSIEVVAAGNSPEDGFTGYRSFGGGGVARWGDYNTAVTGTDGAIWMVVQYIGNFPRTTYANWNTFVIRQTP